MARHIHIHIGKRRVKDALNETALGDVKKCRSQLAFWQTKLANLSSMDDRLQTVSDKIGEALRYLQRID